MAIYKYLGYGVTNSKGKAKLDHDKNGDPITHSYTGTGAGELDIIASLDNPSTISDSSIQSETYELLDTVYYDKATSDSYNDTGSLIRMTKERQADGTVLTGTGSGCHWLLKQNTQIFELPFIIEFDILERTASGSAIDFQNPNNTPNNECKAWFSNTGHYILQVTRESVSALTGSLPISYNNTNRLNGLQRVSINLSSNGDTVKYANLKIYPI